MAAAGSSVLGSRAMTCIDRSKKVPPVDCENRRGERRWTGPCYQQSVPFYAQKVKKKGQWVAPARSRCAPAGEQNGNPRLHPSTISRTACAGSIKTVPFILACKIQFKICSAYHSPTIIHSVERTSQLTCSVPLDHHSQPTTLRQAQDPISTPAHGK